MPQVGSTFSPYFSPGPLMPAMLPADPSNSLALVQQNAVAQQKIARTDRIEVSPDSKNVTVYLLFLQVKFDPPICPRLEVTTPS